MNIENNVKEDLKKIIDEMNLELEQKIMWHHFIEVSRDKDIQLILEAVQEDPKNIDVLSKNMQDKVRALLEQDEDKLNKVISEEEEFLK